MTLRHIDPGSLDWMDAMLEGEPARRPTKELARDALTPPESGESAAGQQDAAPPGQLGLNA